MSRNNWRNPTRNVSFKVSMLWHTFWTTTWWDCLGIQTSTMDSDSDNAPLSWQPEFVTPAFSTTESTQVIFHTSRTTDRGGIQSNTCPTRRRMLHTMWLQHAHTMEEQELYGFIRGCEKDSPSTPWRYSDSQLRPTGLCLESSWVQAACFTDNFSVGSAESKCHTFTHKCQIIIWTTRWECVGNSDIKKVNFILLWLVGNRKLF